MLNNFSIVEFKLRLINTLTSKFGFSLNMFDLAEKTQTIKNISLFFYNINNLKIQNVINLNFSWNSVTIFFTFFTFFFTLFVLFVLFFFI